MSSNGKSTLFGDSRSEKPKGVEADSFPKPTGTPYVSFGFLIGDLHSKKAKGEASVSSGLTKPSGKTGVSSGVSIGVPNSKNPSCTKTGVSSGVRGKAAVSSGAKGKAIVSAKAGEVMSFKDVKFGPHEGELRFRLIHFWEARNVVTKVLIGLEMLLIDQEETVIQGFIPAGRIDTYLPHMKAGGIYRLNSFFGSNNKTLYWVAEPKDSSVCFPEDHFQFHGYEEFDAACDLRGDLYDYVGHIKLVNGQVLNDSLLVQDDAEIASSRRVLLHVQTHDVLAASNFSEKFKAYGGTASVILVTTLNPKRFGGALSLSSMTSSRVFLDSDVQATQDYLTWLNSNLVVANKVDADVVTKTKTVTIGELFSYMKQDATKVAWFECIATIGDVVHGSGWYYIGCGVCHTKATKGSTTLMCKKCGKSDIVGVAQQVVFSVLLGDAGQELTGKKASELVDSYFEANENVGDDHLVPVPQALINTIGQTRKFIVKNGVAEDDPSTCFEKSDGERVKRAADNVETEDSKRAKCG
ncbi:BnaCnng41260D [Brassica napus]|uniref:BnaCnng41260D protein n=1 Tax=Brassica napus TaxID=3708 RepID=A0A078JBC5_BRANA|nr:BnaCnng41260D [Brassica napus]